MDYFEQLGTSVKVVKNDIESKKLDLSQYNGIVISPGPESPDKANKLMSLLPLFVDKIPTLGICLGHQALAQYFGAHLVKADKPMHGKISRISHQGGLLFENLPKSIDVVRYHSLVIKNLPSGLQPLALTSLGELMAFQSENKMVCGIQFHPEAALTQYGLEMLNNWLSFHNIV